MTRRDFQQKRNGSTLAERVQLAIIVELGISQKWDGIMVKSGVFELLVIATIERITWEKKGRTTGVFVICMVMYMSGAMTGMVITLMAIVPILRGHLQARIMCAEVAVGILVHGHVPRHLGVRVRLQLCRK